MKLKMIINLFSIFDPSTSLLTSLNWLRIIIILIILPYQYWWIPARSEYIWILITNYIFNEFKILINYSYSNLIVFISLLSFIFINNFLGLFPYVFTSTSHLRLTFSLSFTLWLRLMIYRIFNYLNNLFTHLTPQGTPPILIPFIVIIESISLIIRPFTLAIRLSANIIAGHLLLSLLGSSSQSILTIPLLLLTQILLYTLEITVSFIQAYVFSILSTLYRREI